MTDQHHDDTPSIANVILTDITNIKETLEYHKDVFQAITTGWSNTTTTGILPKHSVVALSAESSKTVSSLTATAVYRVTYAVDLAADGLISVRFNADTGNNYVVINRYEYDGSTAAAAQASDAATDAITLSSEISASGVHIGTFTFAASPADNTRVIVNFRSSLFKPSAYRGFRHGMGYYDGASNLTSFTLVSGQNMTGNMVVERIA